MLRRPPRSTQGRSSAVSDVYEGQGEVVAHVVMFLADYCDFRQLLWNCRAGGGILARAQSLDVAGVYRPNGSGGNPFDYRRFHALLRVNVTMSVNINFMPHVLSLIHISEPTRQAEISYAVFCLKKKKKKKKRKEKEKEKKEEEEKEKKEKRVKYKKTKQRHEDILQEH